jgi:hypothetical protein
MSKKSQPWEYITGPFSSLYLGKCLALYQLFSTAPNCQVIQSILDLKRLDHNELDFKDTSTICCAVECSLWYSSTDRTYYSIFYSLELNISTIIQHINSGSRMNFFLLTLFLLTAVKRLLVNKCKTLINTCDPHTELKWSLLILDSSLILVLILVHVNNVNEHRIHFILTYIIVFIDQSKTLLIFIYPCSVEKRSWIPLPVVTCPRISLLCWKIQSYCYVVAICLWWRFQRFAHCLQVDSVHSVVWGW